jgi:transcriptional regulator with XRE-family HTH domain
MPKSFGERLKKVRIDRGLRQEDIGAIVHVGKSTVSQWENNIHVPDIETIVKIANYLNVTSDYLLGLTNVRNPIETIAAHHDGDEWTEEELAEIEKFKEFVRMKRQQREKKE